jgi:hypothetical protein
MKIPMHKPEPAIDFHPFVDELEKKYGFKFNDMAGRYNYHFELKKKINEKYGDLTWYTTSPKDHNEEQKKAHEEYKEGMKQEPPYENVWHWLLDHDFCELRRGGYNSIWLEKGRDAPPYVKKFLDAMREEVKGHEAFDGESVNFYVDW